MCVIEMIEDRLKTIGADGLCTKGCGCRIGDIAPCRSHFGECEPGLVVWRSEAKHLGFDFGEDDLKLIWKIFPAEEVRQARRVKRGPVAPEDITEEVLLKFFPEGDVCSAETSRCEIAGIANLLIETGVVSATKGEQK